MWFLAFAPLMGYFLEAFVASIVSGGNEWEIEQAMSNGSYFYISVLLNVGLSYFDERKLTKAGHNTEHFKGMTWLVPVYLFKRAQHLNQSKAYFGVWIASFVLVLLAVAGA